MIVCTMGKSIQLDLKMEEELFSIMMARYIKASLKMILKKDMEYRLILMDLSIVVSLRLEREMAKVDFNGLMDSLMMDNG